MHKLALFLLVGVVAAAAQQTPPMFPPAPRMAWAAQPSMMLPPSALNNEAASQMQVPDMLFRRMMNMNNPAMMMGMAQQQQPQQVQQFAPTAPFSYMMPTGAAPQQQQGMYGGNDVRSQIWAQMEQQQEAAAAQQQQQQEEGKQQQQQQFFQQPLSSIQLMSMFPPPFEMMGMMPKHASEQPQQVRFHPHPGMAGRPSAPDVSASASSTGEQMNVQTQATTSSESTMGTLLGSLSSTGSQIMGSAHTLFTPPYTWMWRAGMTGASLKYDNLDRIAEIPELLGLITGYFANDPVALAAVERARANEKDDPFGLSSLAQVFGTSTKKDSATAKKSKESEGEDDNDSTASGLDAEEEDSYYTKKNTHTAKKATSSHSTKQATAGPLDVMLHPFSSLATQLTGGAPAASANSWDDLADDDDEAIPSHTKFNMNSNKEESSSSTSSWMNSLFGGDSDSSHHDGDEDELILKNLKAKKKLFADDDDNSFYTTYGDEKVTKKSSTKSNSNSLMDGMFKELMGGSDSKKGHSTKKTSSSGSAAAGLASMMSALSGGHNDKSNPTASMIKMAAPMLGIDPSVANMAAPILSSMF